MIKQRVFTLLPCFDIEIGGREMGNIQKEFTFFKNSFSTYRALENLISPFVYRGEAIFRLKKLGDVQSARGGAVFFLLNPRAVFTQVPSAHAGVRSPRFVADPRLWT